MLYLVLLFSLTGCQFIPEMAKDLESIETDTAIKVEVSREAIGKETNVEVTVNIQNKTAPGTILSK